MGIYNNEQNDTNITPITIINDFVNFTQIVKQIFDNLDVSDTTVIDYKSRIPLFIKFIQENGFNRNSLIQFKKYLINRFDYSTSTKNKYFASARVLLKELHNVGAVPIDISSTAKCFPQIKKHKRVGFSQKEIEKLLEYVQDLPKNNLNVRLKALLSLLIFQGLRQIEIIRLNVEDVNLSSATAMVQGKGQQDKELVYLHPESVKALKTHIRFNKMSSGALFRGLGNTGNSPISTMVIKREIKRITEPLSIDKTVHGFRHYYITTLLNKLDVRDVRKFSRHKSLEMLIVYDDEMDISAKSNEVFHCFDGLNVT